MKKFLIKIKENKEKGVLYGILFVIPMGIPIIICIEVFTIVKKQISKSKIKIK